MSQAYIKSTQTRQQRNTITLNLRGGGTFVSFNENPFKPVHDGIKYGVGVKRFGELRDGTKIERTHFLGEKKDFSFEHYHYEAETYERCLKNAGFSHIEWTHLSCVAKSNLS